MNSKGVDQRVRGEEGDMEESLEWNIKEEWWGKGRGG